MRCKQLLGDGEEIIMYWILRQKEQIHSMEKSIWRRLWTCH